MPEPTPLPPIANEALSVVLLARNDEARLAAVLAGWTTHLDSLNRAYEIIVVDDGSTDGTAALATSLADQQLRLRVLIHPAPHGLGAAVRTGLAAARFPLFFYTTCDEQYQPADLALLLAKIDQLHLISGYRVSAPVPTWLRWLGRVYRGFLRVLTGDGGERLPGWLGWSGHLRHLLARIFFGVRNDDVDCAFRLFRRSIFARIPIQSDGPFAQVEILAKANFLGCLMSEEPVTHRPLSANGPDRTRAPFKQTWREVLRLLRHPDFGPARLPEEPTIPGKAAPVKEEGIASPPRP